MNESEKKAIACPTCNGLARDIHYKVSIQPCPRCRFSGQILIDSDAEKCLTCGGNGKDNSFQFTTVLCPNCKGDGYVLTPLTLELRKIAKDIPKPKSESLRIHIDDIDSFVKVKNVSADNVSCVLNKGRLEISENAIKKSIEDILFLTLEQKDWGGEFNDLYTANVVINNKRVPTAFMLKGSGTTASQLHIKNCGKNGDQLQRLFLSPSELNIVQYIGNIGQDVIREVEAKADYANKKGHRCQYCIVDGLDTARLLWAYLSPDDLANLSKKT